MKTNIAFHLLLATAATLVVTSPVRADDTSPKILCERIEWCDMHVDETGRTDLPRVLFIGDSISAGYRGPAMEALKGKAYFAFLCTSKALGHPIYFEEIKLMLGQYKFDVIHFNVGMHGWDYTEDDYRAAFPKLIALLKKKAPGAKLIWATTTPYRTNGPKFDQFDPRNERVKARNRIAAEFVARENIPTDDLYALEIDHPEHSADGVHFKTEAKTTQGKQVAKFIGEALASLPSGK